MAGKNIVAAVKGGTKVNDAVTESLLFALSRVLAETQKAVGGGLLQEADPKPKVERDHLGSPLVPSREDFAQYFASMQRGYVQSQLATAEDIWRQAGGKSNQKEKHDQAEMTALEREIAAAREILGR